MLIRLAVFLIGGRWSLRKKCRTFSFAPLRKVYRLLYASLHSNSGAAVSWETQFGIKPCLSHGIHGIFISRDVVVGKNCVIFQHVTIGSNTLVDSKTLGAPRIGDNCYIGAGAIIVGKITIGNNVRIAANAAVYEDVPDNCIVVSGRQTNIPRETGIQNRMYLWKGRWIYYDDGVWIPETDQESISRLNQAFDR